MTRVCFSSNPALKVAVAAGFLLVGHVSSAESTWSPDVWKKTPSEKIPLWRKGAPDAMGKGEGDVPTITPYFAPPTLSTGAAMLVCPGGAYGKLTPHEGVYYAFWLNELGVSAFVLDYRLGSDGYRHPAMMNDALRAMRLIRFNAREWNLDPNRIGVIGSSAGGHLASTALTHFDTGNGDTLDPIERCSSRPDLGILCYPVITMGAGTHAGTKRNLLGSRPDETLVNLLSNQLHVGPETPPTFLFHTEDDAVVPVGNSLLFAESLKRHGVVFEIRIDPSGPHGIGLGSRQWDPDHRHPWTRDCADWLRKMKFAR